MASGPIKDMLSQVTVMGMMILYERFEYLPQYSRLRVHTRPGLLLLLLHLRGTGPSCAKEVLRDNEHDSQGPDLRVHLEPSGMTRVRVTLRLYGLALAYSDPSVDIGHQLYRSPLLGLPKRRFKRSSGPPVFRSSRLD